MKVRLTGLFALCSALALMVTFSNSQKGQSQTTTDSASNGLSQAEQDLLTEINLARTQPAVYASYLEAMKPLFKGNLYTRPGHGALTTVEGWSAVEEAIRFVRAAKPQSPLSLSNGLRLAAVTLCTEQSGSGSTGHKGGGGLIEDRVKPFGTWQGAIGENLSYGDESARERVLTWLIDDGVASRGHRKRILSADYRTAGISCTPHPKFGKVCALTLAGSFMDSAAARQATNNQPNSTGAGNNNTIAKPSTTATKTNANKNTNKGKTTTKPPSF
jgi:uncharacterized protein YkwD